MFKIKIKDKTIDYSIEYRKVKYTRYEFRNGKLKIILPKQSNVDIEEQIHKKDNWIYRNIVKHEQLYEKLSKRSKNKSLENRSLSELKRLAKKYISEYQIKLDVKANRVQYRDMVNKWGSCSSLKNITLATQLKYLPEHLIRYVVYHELTHIIVLAHNNEFFEIIKREFENYKKYDEELSDYWYLINQIEY